MDKFPSNLLINRLVGVAEGLAISKEIREQIRGFDITAENSQDAISLIQVADGGLNETHALLQRMRELIVQSENDTNTDSDCCCVK